MRATIAFVVVFGVVGVAAARPDNGKMPIEKVFREIAGQAPKGLAPNPDHWLRFKCVQYIQNGIVPAEFKMLNNKLWAHYRKREYSDCANAASQMVKLIPSTADEFTFGPNSVEISSKFEKSPRSGRPSGDTIDSDDLILWQVQIGNFRALGNDYTGALKDYESARKMKPISHNPKDGTTCVAHASAAYGQALTHALLGHRNQALIYLREAPNIAPSRCGNCRAGELTETERLHLTFDAATLPGAKAEAALERLVRFGPPAKKAVSPLESPSWDASEILSVRVDATFMLGELYLRRGKTGLAKQAFEAVQNFQFTDKAQMAISRVRSLSQKQSRVYEGKRVLHL